MTVKTDHGQFEVSDITFAQRRAMHRIEIGAVQGSEDVDPVKFYELLEHVREIAFGDDAEKHLSKLNDNEIIIINSLFNSSINFVYPGMHNYKTKIKNYCEYFFINRSSCFANL